MYGVENSKYYKNHEKFLVEKLYLYNLFKYNIFPLTTLKYTHINGCTKTSKIIEFHFIRGINLLKQRFSKEP